MSDQDRSLLSRADTLFIASAHEAPEAGAARGVDVSHRGGLPGFVRVEDERTFAIPDYAGNRFLNTIGNLAESPRAGLLFIDFESGDVLYVAATAEIIWGGPALREFEGAQRVLRFHVHETRRSTGVLPYHWTPAQFAPEFQAGKMEPVAPVSGWMPLRVADVVDESKGIRSFLLESASGAVLPGYAPGRYLPVRVVVPGAEAPFVRSYTLSDVHDGRFYRISVKRDGVVSNWLHEHATRGALIEAMPPRGTFGFDSSSPRPAVFLSAGIGITPMISMLKHALTQGGDPARRLYFVHGARTDDDHPFRAALEALAADYPRLSLHLLNSAHADTGGGRIDVAWLKRILPFDDYDFYLCGPTAFMRDLYNGLRALNVADERIRFEAFGPASITRTNAKVSVPDAADTTRVPVSFRRSETTVEWQSSSGSLLDLAEMNGVPASSSCRSGTCGTCETRVLAGGVAYLQEPAAPVAQGCALICIARPETSGCGAANALVLDL